MIQRVFEQACKSESLEEVIVATDDDRIHDHVSTFGGKAVMTSAECRNGTERCYEACTNLDSQYDFIVNIQGDEPFISPSQIDELCSLFSDSTQIATLAKKIENLEELNNQNVNKVIFDKDYHALYFSRTPIPFYRNADKEKWLENHSFFKHIGIYGYKYEILNEIVKLDPTALEQAESLEQLRWLENGYKIRIGITDTESIGIDTPEDLEIALLKHNN